MIGGRGGFGRRGIASPRWRYWIYSTGESSEKFGNCEVCGGHVSHIYHQAQFKWQHGKWDYSSRYNLFGHKACLESKRRSPHIVEIIDRPHLRGFS